MRHLATQDVIEVVRRLTAMSHPITKMVATVRTQNKTLPLLFVGTILNSVPLQRSVHRRAPLFPHHRKTTAPGDKRGRIVWRLIPKPPVLCYRCNNETTILIDTGAEVSVLPPRVTDRPHRQGADLQAASSSTIATYGTRSLTLNLGLRRSFAWIFTLADCADFLRHFNLLVDLRNRSLNDAVTHLRINDTALHYPLSVLYTLHYNQHLLHTFSETIPI